MNKKIKNFILSVVLLAVCALSAILLPAGDISDETPTYDGAPISVEIATKGQKYLFKRWEKNNRRTKECYLIIPGTFSKKEHTLNITAADSAQINGKVYGNRQTVDNLREGLNSLEIDGESYNLYVYYTGEIPSVHISTESGGMENIKAERKNKEAADIQIVDSDENTVSASLEYIKGRGNSSWWSGHPGYNIKFRKDTDLFGMGRAKKWSFLTPFMDGSLMKNGVAYKMSEILNMEYTPQQQHVDLFINGEYLGVYMLTERIEIGKDKIPVFNLEDMIDSNNGDINKQALTPGAYYGPAGDGLGSFKWVEFPRKTQAVNGGYILEYELAERYNDELCGFVTMYGQTIILKQPSYAPREQVDLIYNYYQEFEDALVSESGYNSKGKHYTDYIDTDSMVSAYLIQEWAKNADAGNTSFFLYKDVNSKYKAGPVWDFDHAFGIQLIHNDTDMSDPSGLWAGQLNIYKTDKKSILALLYSREEFARAAKEKWNTVMVPRQQDILHFIDNSAAGLEKSVFTNKVRWSDTTDYRQALNEYRLDIDNLKNFISRRRDYLTGYYNG